MEMKQKLYDLKNTRKTLLDEAVALVEEGKLGEETYAQKLADIEAMNTKIEGMEALITQEEKTFAPGNDPQAGPMKAMGLKGDPEEDPVGKAVKAFAAAFRAGFPATKDLKEGVNEDGGYTVPEDIVTRVETFRDAKFSLRQLVGVETVTTKSGARTYKKRSQQTGFSEVAEGGKITKKASPQFSRILYAIKKYAGFLPVTNELLEDSDENIAAVMTEWMGDEARVTDNNNILAVIKAKAATAIAGLDDIKRALIVTLGSAFLGTSKIITNDDGLFWLATLKDNNGRDLLAPIPSDPGKMQISVGARVVPVEIIPSNDLPTTGTKIPFIIGDLKEGIRLFDRKQITMTNSTVAVAGDLNAFENDLTLVKGILRQDVRERDGEAYLYCELDTAAPAVQAAPLGGEPVGPEIYTEAGLTAKTNPDLWAIAQEVGAEGVTANSNKAELVAAILAVV